MVSISERNEFVLIFFLLGSLIIIFNFPDIFLSKTMYVDDHHRYILGLKNQIHESIFKRNTVRAYVIFPLYKLLSINLMYARLAQTICFYLPLAFSFYLLLRLYTTLPLSVVFCSSLLPCILPGQTQIPSFIDGSYTVQGLLSFTIMLLASFKFLSLQKFYLWRYILSVFIYAISLEMMDHSVFLLPIAIISYFFVVPFQQNWKKIAALSIGQGVLALLKTLQMLYSPTVSASVPVKPSWDMFVDRLSSLITATLPFSYSIFGKPINSFVLLLIFSLIILIGSYKAKRNDRILICLGLGWAFCSSITFLTVSRFYSSRYAHIPGFGINFSFVMSLWVIFQNLKIRFNKNIFFILLICIVIFSGSSRILHLSKIFTPQNNTHDVITSTLSKYNFPENSQIIIINGGRIPTGGWWNYSSGYFKYATRRKDVTGLIGPEKGFYNPYDSKKRGFSPDHQMSGLTLENPAFYFRLDCKQGCELYQKEYSLQWESDSWKVYKFNLQTGNIEKVYKGSDIEEFNEFLRKNKLTQNDIVFAKGMPSYLN